MALVTPEYLQTKKYRALRDRLVLQHGGQLQAGVWDAGDFKITQRGTGANGSVDAAAGFALVQASDPGNRGLYHAENDATLNVTSGFLAGHATLPRVDSVILTVNDTTDGADATDVPSITIVNGTATAGATLDNRTGAPTIPNSSLILADLLMPAASTTATTANIRDRRARARGAYFRYERNAAGDYTTTSTSMVAIDATNMEQRVECNGNSLRVALLGDTFNGGGVGGSHFFEVRIDGAVLTPTLKRWRVIQDTSGGVKSGLLLDATVTPTAGSRKLGAYWASGGAYTSTLKGDANFNSTFIIEEILKPNASNT